MEQQHRRRKRRSGLLIAAGLISVGLVAAACGSDNKESTNTTTATTGGASTTAGGATTSAAPATTVAATTTTLAKPTPGGKLTVGVEAETANPWTPANMQCDSGCQMRALTFYEPLAAWNDETKKVEPYLAKSITPNADSSEWTIGLRDDITFTDGTPLNADVVVDNLEAEPEVVPRGRGDQGHHRRHQGRRQDREGHASRDPGTTSPTSSPVRTWARPPRSGWLKSTPTPTRRRSRWGPARSW